MTDVTAPAVSTPVPDAGGVLPSAAVHNSPVSAESADASAVSSSADSPAADVALDKAAVPATEATPAVADTAPAPAAAVEAPAPEGEQSQAEEVTEQAQPQPRTYTDFALPEGFKAEPASLSAYHNVLGKYDLSQEAGQELIDFHINEMKSFQAQQAQASQDAFAEMRRGWVRDFEKQSGNRRDTVLGDAKFAISEVVKDKKQQKAVFDALALTGAGDHPAIINAWAQVGKRLRERGAPPAGLPADPKNSLSPAERRYGRRA